MQTEGWWFEQRLTGIHEGDWFKTKNSTHTEKGRARPVCFEYKVNPEMGWGRPAHELKIQPYPLPLSTYIGPVHGKAEKWEGYVTVRVPSFWEPNRMCWVNVSILIVCIIKCSLVTLDRRVFISVSYTHLTLPTTPYV